MKKHLISGVALIAMAAAPAMAADMRVRAPVVRTLKAIAPSWTGFYVGGLLGAQWTDNDWQSTNVLPLAAATGRLVFTGPNSASFNSSATRVGVYGGYNWQIAPTWLIGIEADFGWAHNTNTATVPGTANRLFGVVTTGLPIGTVKETQGDGSVRGRFGILITPDILLYGTAGVAWQQSVPKPEPLSGGRMSASAGCGHWSERAVQSGPRFKVAHTYCSGAWRFEEKSSRSMC
jgi:outer membrane immunogenic protein